MRVSKNFKATAAPIFLETLDWKYMKRDPTKLVREGDVIKAGTSGIETKESELQHIKSIELREHQEHDCSVQGKYARRPPLMVPVVRIGMGNTEPFGDKVPNIRFCQSHRSCPPVRGLRAKKIVVTTNSNEGKVCLDQFNAKSLQEHVVKLHIREEGWRCPELHSESKADRLVIISASADHISSIDPLEYRSDALRNCIRHMAEQLAYDSRLRHSTRQILMVNFDDLDNRFHRSTTISSGTFETAYKRSIGDLAAKLVILPHSRRWKTASEAALTSVKFIKMKEYLDNHDWEGVYTAEEVADFMQAEERKNESRLE
jgi:hypothetical protein